MDKTLKPINKITRIALYSLTLVPLIYSVIHFYDRLIFFRQYLFEYPEIYVAIETWMLIHELAIIVVILVIIREATK